MSQKSLLAAGLVLLASLISGAAQAQTPTVHLSVTPANYAGACPATLTLRLAVNFGRPGSHQLRYRILGDNPLAKNEIETWTPPGFSATATLSLNLAVSQSLPGGWAQVQVFPWQNPRSTIAVSQSNRVIVRVVCTSIRPLRLSGPRPPSPLGAPPAQGAPPAPGQAAPPPPAFGQPRLPNTMPQVSRAPQTTFSPPPGFHPAGVGGAAVSGNPVSSPSSVSAQPKLVNGQIEWGNLRMLAKQGSVIPQAASFGQRIRASLPAYFQPRAQPRMRTVHPSQNYKATVTTLRFPPQGLRNVLNNYRNGINLHSASGLKYHAGSGLPTPGGVAGNSPPLNSQLFTPLNEGRQARIEKLLTSSAPAPWSMPTPLPSVTSNPNNFLVDPISVWSFSGQFDNGGGRPCSSSPSASPFPPPDPSAPNFQPPGVPFCLGAPLIVQGPVISITVPTHVEIVSGGSYSAEAIAANVTMQILETDAHGEPITSASDPDGVEFINYYQPGNGVDARQNLQPPATPQQNSAYQYTCPQGQAGTAYYCPPGEAFDPQNPIGAWIYDTGADSQISTASISSVCQQLQVSSSSGGPSQPQGHSPQEWAEIQNCAGPPIAYPDYGVMQDSNPADFMTFTLQLTTPEVVVRFLITNGYQVASVVIPIVVAPTAIIQGDYAPVALVYEPPGNLSTAGWGSGQSGSATFQTQFQLSSTQSQQTTNSQSWTASGKLTIPLINDVSLSGSVGGSSSSTQQNQTSQTTTSSAAFAASYADQSTSKTGWPQTQKDPQTGSTLPPSAPALTVWQSGVHYCDGGSINLVTPNPPDGNAYLCTADGYSGSTQPPFSSVGITTDGGTAGATGTSWINAGSAAVFQSPFWNDTFYLAPQPLYALWNFAGLTPNGIEVAPLPPSSPVFIPWVVSVFQLHLCAEGLGEVENTSFTPPLTLSPFECASLLSLDPFYLYGQHATLSEVNASGPVAITAQSGGASFAPNQNVYNIQNVTASSTSSGQQTGSSTSTNLTTVNGTTQSLGVTIGDKNNNGGLSGTTSSSQQQSSAFTSNLLSSVSTTTGTSTTYTASLQSGNGGAPDTNLWMDTRFGTVMFPSVGVSINPNLTSQSGCPGQKVYISGAGLTGTTTVTIGGIPVTFLIDNDYEIAVWVPSTPALPVGGTFPVAIQGEGFGSTPVVQFQLTSSCSGN